ncbi:hypothetical protein CPLU01_13503 [Colletotrichum plurivorum]|uniref:Uncharacterized protein n=1 Tax=Colletotrichum plurivorum TaxID=2175906 RepID=A0A8H6N324_9PEZI|nr:hypothetical protein CPLU01_13503 [Colletotrichum plurivorum]
MEQTTSSNATGSDQSSTAGPPTPQTPTLAGSPPEMDRQPLHKTPVSFAVDISGSTYGPTLEAEKTFIRNVSSLLSPRARFSSKILPWDDKAHPILSLAQVNSLEDRGGTDPGALLSDARHNNALKGSSLWFLMTDGLIPDEARARFAHDIAKHGIHGISCIIVIFGNPTTGPASCDISVGVSVFATVPNCAFLFCDENNGSLRVMQTKGCFDVLLKGQSHPVFDSSSRWDLLPQVFVTDFASILVPTPEPLGSNQVALQDSLVINMDDLFANRLSPDQVARIFSNLDNLDSVRMTSQARNQQGEFRHWLHQQTIRPNDPVSKPRPDRGGRAGSYFTELVDLVSRGQPPPAPLQARLRAAYRDNMRRFVADAQGLIKEAEERSEVIGRVSTTSFSPIDHSPALRSPSHDISHHRSAPLPRSAGYMYESGITPELGRVHRVTVTPQNQIMSVPIEPPGAPRIPHRVPRRDPWKHRGIEEEEPWGSWEANLLDQSLRGLLYTAGLQASRSSFRGTCPLCGATGMTMAWIFRSPLSGPYKSPTPEASTQGFPVPGSRTRLAFPLAMGHFPETSGVLASLPSASTPIPGRPSSSSLPTLVCDPCSVMFARQGPLSFGITAALPMVRFTENRSAVLGILAGAFENRFAEGDLPQVFLSVLMSAAAERSVGTPRFQPTPAPSEMDFDISATMAAAAAAGTFRAAVEWTVRDLLYSVTTLRELTESFSLPSDTPAPVWPLATVLAGSFEELDSLSGNDGPQGLVMPLLRYPLPGFITILKAAPLLSVGIELRRRAAFRRLMYLVCEELGKVAEQVPHSQSVAELFGGLLGRPLSTGPDQKETEWEPSVSVSILSLRAHSLLSAASYDMISRAEEFRYLEDPGCVWAGPALALFLHGLFSQVSRNPWVSALKTFQAMTRMDLIGNALLRPEGVGNGDVRSVLSEMQSR